MAKNRINKSERLRQSQKEHEDWLKSKGYKGGKTLRGKNGRRIGVYDVPDLRDGLRDVPKTSDVICSNGNKKDAQKYTGTMVKGIATMHKSNAIPITSDEQMIEVSQMRRQ